MQLVDRVTSAGYSYVSPTVDRACNVLPFVGGVKQRIEPYAPPLIQKADLCIDTVYTIAEGRVTALRSMVTTAQDRVLDIKTTATCKAQTFIEESAVVARVQKTSLALVDTLDMLIDRYLPAPLDKSGSKDQQMKEPEKLIPRLLFLPFKIPARMVHITVVKMQNGHEIVQVNIRWAIQLTSDQKAKLKAVVLSRSRAIVDRASSSSLAVSLKQGKQGASLKMQAALDSLAAGKKAVGVKCYVVCERLHVIEVKDYTIGLGQSATDCASGILIAASQRAFSVTAYIAGQERATGIFTMIGEKLPVLKTAMRLSASTGSLSDASSRSTETPEKTPSSTGSSAKQPLSPVPSPGARLFNLPRMSDASKDDESFHDADSYGDADSAGYLPADYDSAGEVEGLAAGNHAADRSPGGTWRAAVHDAMFENDGLH